MNNLVKTIAAVGVCFVATGAMANSSKFEAMDNQATTHICVAAAEGKNYQLRRMLKESGLSKKYVAEKLSCNGIAFVEFVETYGKQPVATNNYITAGRYSRELDTNAVATR